MTKISKKEAKILVTMLDKIPLPTEGDINKVKLAAYHCKSYEEFAEFLDIEVLVLKHWVERSPSCYKAFQTWREHTNHQVEVAMAKRAIGFTKKTNRDVITRAGIQTLVNETYYPPSETAGQFWLKNRKSEDWKDKTEVDINVTANIRAWLVEAGEVDLIDITPTKEIALIETIEGEIINSIQTKAVEEAALNNDANIQWKGPLNTKEERPLNVDDNTNFKEESPLNVKEESPLNKDILSAETPPVAQGEEENPLNDPLAVLRARWGC